MTWSPTPARVRYAEEVAYLSLPRRAPTIVADTHLKEPRGAGLPPTDRELVDGLSERLRRAE
jgi:hypothetical protein